MGRTCPASQCRKLSLTSGPTEPGPVRRLQPPMLVWPVLCLPSSRAVTPLSADSGEFPLRHPIPPVVTGQDIHGW